MVYLNCKSRVINIVLYPEDHQMNDSHSQCDQHFDLYDIVHDLVIWLDICTVIVWLSRYNVTFSLQINIAMW